MKNKKGQLDQLQGIIIALVIIGMVLVVAFLIFAQTKTQVVDMISSATSTNESLTFANATLTALTHSPGTVELSCAALYNNTANTQLIGSGNYTCTTGGITITDAAGTLGIPATVYATYTYKTADYAYNSTNTVQNATQDIPGWLPIIVVVVIGALLIGLVSFLKQRM